MIRKFVYISFVYILCVLATLAQAQTITYPKVNKFAFGKVIDTLRPVVTGDISTFAIKPDLPRNLKLDPTKGIITGTLNEILVDSNYTITATDKTGKTVPFPLIIKTLPPPSGSQTVPINQKNDATQNFSLGWIIFLCLILVVFIIVAAFRSQVIKKEALGFPRGSIRSIIAILFVIFFALLSAIFYFDSGSASSYSQDLAKQILTVLGTLVTAVSSFYFGAKATEQGNKIATEAFQSITNPSPAPNPGPKPLPTPTPQPGNTPDPGDIIRAAIQQNQDLKTKFTNIINMLVGSMNANGQNVLCVDIHISDGESADIPKLLQVSFNGQQTTVPVDVIPNLGTAKTHAGMGDMLFNESNTDTKGTLGCFLTNASKSVYYALSCCHVFSDDNWVNYTGYNIPPNQTIIDNTTGQHIGNWTFGLMNNSLDIAYATVDNETIVTNSNLKPAREVVTTDILHNTPVNFRGYVTKDGNGFICNNQCTRSVEYGNNVTWPINNLILISNSDNSAPSSEGDSGALVVTNNNEPIGIVVAADDVFTYVIPITTILSTTGLILS